MIDNLHHPRFNHTFFAPVFQTVNRATNFSKVKVPTQKGTYQVSLLQFYKLNYDLEEVNKRSPMRSLGLTIGKWNDFEEVDKFNKFSKKID